MRAESNQDKPDFLDALFRNIEADCRSLCACPRNRDFRAVHKITPMHRNGPLSS